MSCSTGREIQVRELLAALDETLDAPPGAPPPQPWQGLKSLEYSQSGMAVGTAYRNRKIASDGTVRNANNATIGTAKGVKRTWAATYFFFFFKKQVNISGEGAILERDAHNTHSVGANNYFPLRCIQIPLPQFAGNAIPEDTQFFTTRNTA